MLALGGSVDSETVLFDKQLDSISFWLFSLKSSLTLHTVDQITFCKQSK